MNSAARPFACEIRRKVPRSLKRGATWPFAALGLLAIVLLRAGPGPLEARTPAAAAQHGPEGAATREGAAGAAREEAEHESMLWPTIARLANFAILAGTLVYLLRSPLAKYLADRHVRIRRDLTAAAELRSQATEQLAEIDRRLKALPGEIEALKARGAEEIAAQEARIREAAGAERARLLEQTRREIALQLRLAERELLSHAAELAVGVASERIKKDITDEDQARLLDRYVTQVKHRAE